MKLILFIYHLVAGLPDLGSDTRPTGLQLNGNVKSAHVERPRP